MTARRAQTLAGWALAAIVLASAARFGYTSRRSAALAQSAEAPARQQAAPATVRAAVRVQLTAASEASDLFTVCGLARAPEGQPAAWIGWAPQDGARLAATSDASELPVYAARTPEGFAVWIVNRGEAKAELRLETQLPRGVFAVERLVFPEHADVTQPRVERFACLLCGEAGTAAKPGWLPPHTAAVYRYVNLTRQLADRSTVLRQQLADLRKADASAYRRLMTSFGECSDHLIALRSGISPAKRYDSLRPIHRALLTLSYTQALYRNLRGEGRASEELGTALDRLEETLTALSAACAGLTPDVSIEDAGSDAAGSKKVVVSVSNGGSQSVSAVSLGVSGPKTAKVAPAEHAMFPVLGPGETVRAAFTARADDPAALRELTAEIGYIAARAPAHCRLPVYVGP